MANSILNQLNLGLSILHMRTKALISTSSEFPRGTFLSLVWVAGGLETIIGLLLILGLFTRTLAFVLFGEMAVAYFRAHLSRVFWTIQTAEAGCSLLLHLFCTFSPHDPALRLDRLVRKKSI